MLPTAESGLLLLSPAVLFRYLLLLGVLALGAGRLALDPEPLTDVG